MLLALVASISFNLISCFSALVEAFVSLFPELSIPFFVNLIYRRSTVNIQDSASSAAHIVSSEAVNELVFIIGVIKSV